MTTSLAGWLLGIRPPPKCPDASLYIADDPCCFLWEQTPFAFASIQSKTQSVRYRTAFRACYRGWSEKSQGVHPRGVGGQEPTRTRRVRHSVCQDSIESN